MDTSMTDLLNIPYWTFGAITISALMPLLLFALRYAPDRIRSPGARFKYSVVLTLGAYFGVMVLGFLLNVELDVLDILAAAAILLSATFLSFIFWSLIVWGFTLNMLLSIAPQEKGANIDEWINAYLGEGNTERLTADRMQILLSARFVEAGHDGSYQLTLTGCKGAALFGMLRKMFGVSTNG